MFLCLSNKSSPGCRVSGLQKTCDYRIEWLAKSKISSWKIFMLRDSVFLMGDARFWSGVWCITSGKVQGHWIILKVPPFGTAHISYYLPRHFCPSYTIACFSCHVCPLPAIYVAQFLFPISRNFFLFPFIQIFCLPFSNLKSPFSNVKSPFSNLNSPFSNLNKANE